MNLDDPSPNTNTLHASTQTKASNASDPAISFEVIHALFSVGNGVVELAHLVGILPNSAVADRRALDDAIRHWGRVICARLELLKRLDNQSVYNDIQRYLRKTLDIIQPKQGKKPNENKTDIRTFLTNWEALGMRLVASLDGAPLSARSWFNLGWNFGLIGVANLANAKEVRPQLQQAQAQAKTVLEHTAHVPDSLRAFATAQFAKSLPQITAQLRQMARLVPSSEQQSMTEPYATWVNRKKVGHEASKLAWAIELGLEALARAESTQHPGNDERDGTLYRWRKDGMMLKQIRMKLKASAEFEPLDSDQAVHAAIQRYTKRHGLPPLTRTLGKKIN